MSDIVILGGARTAIGTFGGALAGTPPIELATVASKAAIARSGADAEQIGHVVFGHVINTEPRDMYLSRVAAMQAGVPESVPAMNVNRLCGSGAQAVVSAVQALMLGDAEFALAGGAECMSRSPYILPAARWGQKMGDIGSQDMMLGALNCPFGTGHMGVTAENVAAEHDITRERVRQIVNRYDPNRQRAGAGHGSCTIVSPNSDPTNRYGKTLRLIDWRKPLAMPSIMPMGGVLT
ncbi:hypothetical protein LCGC14_2577620 [marine sediment metagenome]|uniref:Thiolase N-terminal domain-containing protein n=1 Tax=marine sediment metagenome TaxID=412755 RepID=A0A0F9D840_9ZZZZ